MMNDDAFARLVGDDVKNRISAEQEKYLSLPENWERWNRCLVTLLESINEQMDDLLERESRERERYEALGTDGLKLMAEMLTDVESRKNKISRFRHHVERKLETVQRLEAGVSDSISERSRTVEFLRKSIGQHKSLLVEANIEPTLVDRALWDSLEGKWEFDQIDIQALIDE